MSRIIKLAVLVALAIWCGAPPSWSQDRADATLRRDVERRFDVLTLRDGIAMRPRGTSSVRSIEVAGGTIALDGQPATGAELRTALGDDADLVLRLSYLSDAARRALFAPPAEAPAQTAPAQTPAVPAAPQVTPPPPAEPVPPAPRPRRSRSDRRSGDQIRIGRDVVVEDGEVVEGDVVAVGGAVRVNGEVEGDVVAVGGSVTLGPQSRVQGDVTVVGGQLHRDDGAEVAGKAQEVSLPGFEFDRWNWHSNPLGLWWRSMLGSAFAFVGTVARVGVLCLLAALVVLFGREYAERAGTMAATSSLKAGAVGVIAQLMFVPLLIVTIVVLVVTIIGIPLLLLLPFALLALAVIGLVGFTGIAQRVGLLTTSRFGWPADNVYAVTTIGVLVLMLPVLLSRLVSLGGGIMFPIAMALGIAGFVIEYLAWTVGFGAVALMRFRRSPDRPATEVTAG
jgi:hypothetical protein